MTPEHRPEILFLCVHNAGRSQLAAAFARQIGGEGVVVYSAGSDPADILNPAVVTAMKEVGIDLGDELPAKFTTAMGLSASVIVTMGCGDACPVYLGKRYLDWDLADPSGKDLESIRQIRDEIRALVNELVAGLTK